jgi:excisionase family DNA binding protein
MGKEQFDVVLQRLNRIEAAIERILPSLLSTFEKRKTLPPQEWFSIEEAAALTGLSEDHVRRHVTAGLLPVSNQGTFEKPYYRIHRKDIDEWMAKRREAACPAPRKKKAPAKYVSRHHNKDA